MSVSGINSGLMASAMIPVNQIIGQDLKAALSQANSDNGNPLGQIVDISKPSQLLSKLSQLQSADPRKFKDVMKEVAGILQKDSTSATASATNKGGAAGGTSSQRCPVCVGCGNCPAGQNGTSTSGTSASGTSAAGGASSALAMLAQTFSSVADTGDLSKLLPASGNSRPGASLQQYAIAQYESSGNSDQSLLDALTQPDQGSSGASGAASSVFGTNGTLGAVQSVLSSALQHS